MVNQPKTKPKATEPKNTTQKAEYKGKTIDIIKKNNASLNPQQLKQKIQNGQTIINSIEDSKDIMQTLNNYTAANNALQNPTLSPEQKNQPIKEIMPLTMQIIKYMIKAAQRELETHATADKVPKEIIQNSNNTLFAAVIDAAQQPTPLNFINTTIKTEIQQINNIIKTQHNLQTEQGAEIKQAAQGRQEGQGAEIKQAAQGKQTKTMPKTPEMKALKDISNMQNAEKIKSPGKKPADLLQQNQNTNKNIQRY